MLKRLCCKYVWCRIKGHVPSKYSPHKNLMITRTCARCGEKFLGYGR